MCDSLCDNDDIKREIKNTFVRTNILIRKFSKCSFDVKCILFISYRLCLYDIALWYKYNCLAIINSGPATISASNHFLAITVVTA